MSYLNNNPYIPMYVANYIIKKSNELDYDINNLKLQKILYFLQAEYLSENGKRLFDEHMEKWKYGPVTPSVYHEYKIFGAKDIKKSDIKVIVRLPREGETPNLLGTYIKEDYDDSMINEEDREIIDSMLHTIGNAKPFDLVEETHKHSIWRDYSDRIMAGIQGMVYSDEEIANYFNSHQEDRKW